MATPKPTITLEQIKLRAAVQTYTRGQSYYRQDAIFSPILRGDTIEARCSGSMPQPYRVWAKLGAKGILEAGCNCEYDWGGDCKHIVALLLTYLNDPDSFADRPTLREALNARSKDDLIDLIEQMLDHDPDLQRIVERPRPGDTKAAGQPVDTESFRRELRSALDYEGGWGEDDWDANPAGQAVAEISGTGERFAQSGDWEGAAAIYCTILEECTAHDQYPEYDEGEFGIALDGVVTRLSDCLLQPGIAANDETRRRIIHALLGLYIWDTDIGGMGVGDDAPEIMLQHLRPEDIPHVRKQIEVARDQQKRRPYGQWGLEAYEDLLAKLDTLDNVDAEETLRRLREDGMYALLVSKLLDLTRYDEAAAVIREHLTAPVERMRGVYLMAQHRQNETAIQLAEETLQTGYHGDLVYWLITQYQAVGDAEGQLRWQLKRMENVPTDRNYKELMAAAKAAGKADAVQGQIRAMLEKQERYDVLALVYLHDEEWDKAWETLPKITPQPGYFSFIPAIDLTVAEQSRHARPERAIPVYVKHARREIDQRNREHYARAAGLLATVRDLYEQIGDEESWLELIDGIREQFKKLPALQDELRRAKL